MPACLICPCRGPTGAEYGTGNVSSDVCHEVPPAGPGALGNGLQAHHRKASLRGSQQLRFRQHRRWVDQKDLAPSRVEADVRFQGYLSSSFCATMILLRLCMWNMCVTVMTDARVRRPLKGKNHPLIDRPSRGPHSSLLLPDGCEYVGRGRRLRYERGRFDHHHGTRQRKGFRGGNTTVSKLNLLVCSPSVNEMMPINKVRCFVRYVSQVGCASKHQARLFYDKWCSACDMKMDRYCNAYRFLTESGLCRSMACADYPTFSEGEHAPFL